MVNYLLMMIQKMMPNKVMHRSRRRSLILLRQHYSRRPGDRSRWAEELILAMNCEPISVLPINYRAIVLFSISNLRNPLVMGNNRVINDFSESGPITQKGLKDFIDFIIKDDGHDVIGFHDHPNEMWVNKEYLHIAKYCSDKGWLKIES